MTARSKVAMSWPRALVTWLAIIVAESLHGTLRQLFLTPIVGDLPARQIGVFIGAAAILYASNCSAVAIFCRAGSSRLAMLPPCA